MNQLWVDKHRPKELEELDYHRDLNASLMKLATTEEFPHLLIYGPNGAGKKTRTMAFLAKVFGNHVYKLTPMSWEFKTSASSSNTVELPILSSNFHLDLNPSDVDQYDRVVLQKLIKEVASSQQISQKVQRPFKVIIINDADRLSKEAQAALRRTMEKYVAKCRLILIAENLGKVIAPIRSRCLCMRVPAPMAKDIEGVLRKVSAQENFRVPDNVLEKISKDCERNLRRGVLLLQTIKMQNTMGRMNNDIPLPEWRQAIKRIADQIMEEQSAKRLRAIRDLFYELLVNCLPGDLILKHLMKELVSKVDHEIKFDIIHWAAHHENKLQMGTKPVFHLEAFAARIMSVLKRYFLDLRAY